jgi:hypothetical protein
MTPSRTMSMRQLGKLFGVTSHQIGRWLTAKGFRTVEGKPSHFAFNGGFVERADNGRGGYYYVWQATKTIAALEQAGHCRIDQSPLEGRLVGPFEARGNGGDGFEIVDSDGATVAWVRGEVAASKIDWLLNLAHKHDRLN